MTYRIRLFFQVHLPGFFALVAACHLVLLLADGVFESRVVLIVSDDDDDDEDSVDEGDEERTMEIS